MKLTDREKLLLLVAPVAVILAGYASWFNLFQRAKLQATVAAYQAAADEAAKISRYDAENAARLNRNLSGEVSRLEKQKQELEARADAVLGHTVDAQQRIAAGGRLTELFARHGLQVLEEGPAVKGGENKLPQSLAGALDRLGKDRGRKTQATTRAAAPAATPETNQVRRFQLVGRYLDLMEAIQELARANDPPGVPIRLAMAEAEADVSGRSWTLWVCLGGG